MVLRFYDYNTNMYSKRLYLYHSGHIIATNSKGLVLARVLSTDSVGSLTYNYIMSAFEAKVLRISLRGVVAHYMFDTNFIML